MKGWLFATFVIGEERRAVRDWLYYASRMRLRIVDLEKIRVKKSAGRTA